MLVTPCSGCHCNGLYVLRQKLLKAGCQFPNLSKYIKTARSGTKREQGGPDFRLTLSCAAVGSRNARSTLLATLMMPDIAEGRRGMKMIPRVTPLSQPFSVYHPSCFPMPTLTKHWFSSQRHKQNICRQTGLYCHLHQIHSPFRLRYRMARFHH
jgi:hypothetical protein